MPPWHDIGGAIAARAQRSLGLLTIEQLEGLGVSRQQRRTLVGKGTLVPLGSGVMRHAAYPTSWNQCVLAAVLAAGDGAVASHMSAATLWRLDGLGRPCSDVEVTVPNRRRPRAVPGVVHRSLALGRADVEPRVLIPRTTAARTLVDISSRLAPAGLEAALDDAERRGLIWRPHLRWRIDALRRSGRPGVPRVPAVSLVPLVALPLAWLLNRFDLDDVEYAAIYFVWTLMTMVLLYRDIVALLG